MIIEIRKEECVKEEKNNNMKIIKGKNYQDLSRKVANIISAQVILKPNCVLGLATGATPIGAYKQLIEWYSKDDIDFSNVKSVNLDEYVGVEENDEQSYRHFMNANLFEHINIKKENTYVPNGKAKDLEAECKRYDSLIEKVGGVDLQLLGMGFNGHIGFNEPGQAFEKTTHVVELGMSTLVANARFFDSINDVPKQALTMGIKAIMQAKKILLVINTIEKKEMLEKAIYGPITPSVPASVLQLHPDVTVVYCEE